MWVCVTALWQKRKLQLSPEQCSDFYAEQYGKLFFPSLTAFMSSGPIIALALARDQAIAHWKTIIGPVNCTKARETHPEWSVSQEEEDCTNRSELQVAALLKGTVTDFPSSQLWDSNQQPFGYWSNALKNVVHPVQIPVLLLLMPTDCIYAYQYRVIVHVLDQYCMCTTQYCMCSLYALSTSTVS